MKNSALAATILLSSALVWLFEYSSHAHLKTRLLSLSHALESSRAELTDLQSRVERARAAVSNEHLALTASRRHLEAAAREAGVEQILHANRAEEGAWPSGRPYFYLPKKHVESMGYDTLDDKGYLSAEAAALLGMSTAEKTAVNSQLQGFRESIQRLQLTHVEWLSSTDPEPDPNHRQIACRIPGMEKEFAELRSGLEASLQTCLGSERSRLFLQHTKGELETICGQYGSQPFTATLSADREADGTVTHTLRLEHEEGNGKTLYTYPVYFAEGPNSNLLPYRHLFGEEPLLTP